MSTSAKEQQDLALEVERQLALAIERELALAQGKQQVGTAGAAAQVQVTSSSSGQISPIVITTIQAKIKPLILEQIRLETGNSLLTRDEERLALEVERQLALAIEKQILLSLGSNQVVTTAQLLRQISQRQFTLTLEQQAAIRQQIRVFKQQTSQGHHSRV